MSTLQIEGSATHTPKLIVGVEGLQKDDDCSHVIPIAHIVREKPHLTLVASEKGGTSTLHSRTDIDCAQHTKTLQTSADCAHHRKDIDRGPDHKKADVSTKATAISDSIMSDGVRKPTFIDRDRDSRNEASASPSNAFDHSRKPHDEHTVSIKETQANTNKATREQVCSVAAIQEVASFTKAIPTLATASVHEDDDRGCLLYTSPSPRDLSTSRMPSSA